MELWTPRMSIDVPISVGELLDMLTILRIKSERISDPDKLANVRRELEALEATWSDSPYGEHDLTAELESTLVEVPMVIGWLRPVILLPVAATTGLSSEQLEAILAHELAHVARRDYLVNLLQSVVETLLFYHPAVWWVSNQIRVEREHCCDDIAVAVSGNVLVYARALTELEELRGRSPAPSLALGGDGGALRGPAGDERRAVGGGMVYRDVESHLDVGVVGIFDPQRHRVEAQVVGIGGPDDVSALGVDLQTGRGVEHAIVQGVAVRVGDLRRVLVGRAGGDRTRCLAFEPRRAVVLPVGEMAHE